MITRVQLENKKSLVQNLKLLGTKKDWLAVNHQSQINSDFDSLTFLEGSLES
jgi:hypothetical protein